MKHILISRLVATWVGIVCLVLVFSPHTKQSRFYSIGPNEHLVVLGGIRVNTIGKYLLIVLYSMINTCIRCAKVNILSPWVTPTWMINLVTIPESFFGRLRSSITKVSIKFFFTMNDQPPWPFLKSFFEILISPLVGNYQGASLKPFKKICLSFNRC